MIYASGIFSQGGGGPQLVNGTLNGSKWATWITYSNGNSLFQDISFPDAGESSEIQVAKNSIVFIAGDATPSVSGSATSIGHNLYYVSGDFIASA